MQSFPVYYEYFEDKILTSNFIVEFYKALSDCPEINELLKKSSNV